MEAERKKIPTNWLMMSLVSVAQWWSITRACWGPGFDSRRRRLRFFFVSATHFHNYCLVKGLIHRRRKWVGRATVFSVARPTHVLLRYIRPRVHKISLVLLIRPFTHRLWIFVWVRDWASGCGQSITCDFSVSGEQKAVFLVSVFDCSECYSASLDHLN